eukprot:SAG31_NODE_6640_length_1942_cov_2.024959_2_plen_154_part_00
MIGLLVVQCVPLALGNVSGTVRTVPAGYLPVGSAEGRIPVAGTGLEQPMTLEPGETFATAVAATIEVDALLRLGPWPRSSASETSGVLHDLAVPPVVGHAVASTVDSAQLCAMLPGSVASVTDSGGSCRRTGALAGLVVDEANAATCTAAGDN